MKRLFLHIGMPKTGSSAIQSWLSARAGALRAEHGVNYADVVPRAKEGLITSGNAKSFVRFCFERHRPKDYTRETFLTQLERIYFAGADRCIASSEGLASATPSAIAELKSALDAAGVSVTVIAFIRSVYDHCWSSYHQAVKRRGYFRTFGEYAAKYPNSQVNALRAWSASFSDLRVFNYDAGGQSILDTFLAACGVSVSNPDARALARVNRSLTGFELELLRGLNRIAAQNRVKLGKKVSNAIIYDQPHEKSCFLYDPQIVARLEERFGADLEWVNATFPSATPMSIDPASRRETRGMDGVQIPRAYTVAVDAVIKKILEPPAPALKDGRLKARPAVPGKPRKRRHGRAGRGGVAALRAGASPNATEMAISPDNETVMPHR